VLAVTASPHVGAADRNDVRQHVRGPHSLERAAYVTMKRAKQSTGRITNIDYFSSWALGVRRSTVREDLASKLSKT
jgi:hypothetical protein